MKTTHCNALRPREGDERAMQEREQGELRDTEEGERHRRRVEVSEHVTRPTSTPPVAKRNASTSTAPAREDEEGERRSGEAKNAPRTKSMQSPPLLRRLCQAVYAVKPPSAKNSGMIWPIHVAASNQGCASSGLEATICPSAPRGQQYFENSGCPLWRAGTIGGTIAVKAPKPGRR